MVTLICAVAENGAIGFQNRLLFPLRADLQRFKKLTTGHTVVMGRNTFESLPKGALPNRRNIVVSSSVSEPWPNTEVFPTLQAALAACTEDSETFIIGGARMYAEGMAMANRLCLTHVHATPAEADVFFPEVNYEEWECDFKEYHPTDEIHPQAFTFADYHKK